MFFKKSTGVYFKFHAAWMARKERTVSLWPPLPILDQATYLTTFKGYLASGAQQASLSARHLVTVMRDKDL